MIIYGVGTIFVVFALFLLARMFGSLFGVLFAPLIILSAVGFALYRLL